MRRNKSQLGYAGRVPLLLHLVVALILCQLVLWATGKQTTVLPARGAGVFTTSEHTTGRTPPPFRSQSHERQPRIFVSGQNRYYNPALASVAERLDAQSRYFVAMALEECYAFSRDGLERFRHDFARRLSPGTSALDRYDNWARERAFSRIIRDCVAFDGAPISPDNVLGLLRSAAGDGDPRAIARTLLFRDLADSKVGSFALVTNLLSTGDPHVIRDVGLFLTRGESSLTIGDGDVPVGATSLAIAWELVACDFGLDCGSDSKLLNHLCAYEGRCGAYSYEDWLGRYTDSSAELAEIRRVRMLLQRGLVMQDWQLLGLSVLKQVVATE